MTTYLPLDFPGLQEEARRLAQERHAYMADAIRLSRLPLALTPWAELTANREQAEVATEALRLADLTRPESQSFWLRVLATRNHGILPPVGAPSCSMFGVDGPSALRLALHAAFGMTP